MRFAVLEPPRTGAKCTLHTLYTLKSCRWRRFGKVELDEMGTSSTNGEGALGNSCASHSLCHLFL